jgi:hypothetical protein
MREVFRVPALESSEILEVAKAQRYRLAGHGADRVDLLGCLGAAKELWTLSGTRRFRLETVSNEELPTESCRTTYDGTEIVLMVPRHIRHRAFVGEGEARFLVARGLGNATLHSDVLLEHSARPRPRFERVVGGCSSAWQAGLFATGFLTGDSVERLIHPEAISVHAGIDLVHTEIFTAHMLASRKI